MKKRAWLLSALLIVGAVSLVFAQFRKECTPDYLRAALGSIRFRTALSVTGEYDAEKGLTGMDGYLSDDPYSRFTIKDLESGGEFKSMYCRHNSSVFQKLLKTRGRVVYTFHGEKNTGDDQEDAFFATEAIFVKEIKPKETTTAESSAPDSLRVTITDSTTGNRTVLVNVVKGQSYRVDNLTIVVEAEPKSKP